MRLTHLAFLATGLLAYTGCSKNDADASETSTENCVVGTRTVNGDVIEGQYIIAYKTQAAATSAAQAMAEARRLILDGNEIPVSAVKAQFTGARPGLVATLTPAELNRIKADGDVVAVEPDRILALSTCFTVEAPSLVTWNINKVGYGNGIGKTAWVVDTGVDLDHPDLTVDANRSRNFVSGATTSDDENGHGTHVAGVIGAKNNTFGVLGVASGATIVSLRVLDKDGKGTLSSVIQALSYISQSGRAGDVVNMSIGEDDASEILDQQVQAVANRGILIAIAAGNDAKSANLFSPGRANGNNIYTVSAVDSLNNFASFSNYGNDVVDYAAPGVRILSTYKDGLYARMSGTSMAAPHVAGLLLLNGSRLNSSGTAANDPDGTPDRIVLK